MRYSEILREAMEEHERLGKEIELMRKLDPKEPKKDKDQLNIIYCSMLMMMSALPIAILDFILIRALSQH